MNKIFCIFGVLLFYFGIVNLKGQAEAKGDDEVYLKKSIDLYRKKDLDSALFYINLSIKLNSSNDVAYFRRSLIHEKLMNPSGTFEDLATAIRLNPQAIYYNNRGLLYTFRENYKAALFDFDQAIALDSTYGLSYYNKASALYYMSELSEACEMMEKANQYRIDGAQEFIDQFCN